MNKTVKHNGKRNELKDGVWNNATQLIEWLKSNNLNSFALDFVQKKMDLQDIKNLNRFQIKKVS